MEIRNTRLQLDTAVDGLASYADVSIQGSEIDILAYVGIYAENVVDISTSHVTINSVEYGIHAEDASISGSDVSIDAPTMSVSTPMQASASPTKVSSTSSPMLMRAF